MELELNIKISDGKVAVTIGGETHEYLIESAPDSAQVRVPVEECDVSHSTEVDEVHDEVIAAEPSVLTVMTWNVDNWSTKKNHSKSITGEQSAEYAKKVREMLRGVKGGVPTLLGMQEYGVVFDLVEQYTTDTALGDYPETGRFEWLKNGKKGDYWAPGGYSNNSSMVNGLPTKVLHDALWLWGSKATRYACSKAGVELKYYYDNEDGSINVPEGLAESDVKTPIGEFAHVLEVEIGGKKVAWANAHLYPSSNRKDYPYNKDVVNWMCLRNLMWVLRGYDYVIISGDLNWISSKFMLDYDEAVSLNKKNYPTVKDDGGEANRYKYAGCGKEGYVTADYALCGYGQTKNRGNNGETDVDVLNTVDCILAKGFRIEEVRKVESADWFDKDHRPVWCVLKMV